MKRKLVVLIAGAALALGARAYAHHSQVAVYQTRTPSRRSKASWCRS